MFQSCHNDVKLPVGTTNERMKTRNNSLKKLHKSRSLKADDLTKGRTNGKFWAHLPWLLLKTLCQSTWIPTTKTLQQPALCLAKCNIDTISDVNLKCPPFNIYTNTITHLNTSPHHSPVESAPKFSASGSDGLFGFLQVHGIQVHCAGDHTLELKTILQSWANCTSIEGKTRNYSN